MKQISDYLKHARECNQLAAAAVTDEHRKLLLEMAKTWITLATEHARMTGQSPPADLGSGVGVNAPPQGLPPAPRAAKATAAAGVLDGKGRK